MVKLDLEMLVFEERGKPEYSEKNVWEQRREPTTNSNHIWRRRRDLNPDHVGGRRALSPLRHPFLPVVNVTANPSLFIFLMINNYISFVEKTNLIKSLLSSNCQLLPQRFIWPVPNGRSIRAIYTRKNKTRFIFPRINGPIVGQWMLHVTSVCTPCCMLLGPEYLRKVWNRSNFWASNLQPAHFFCSVIAVA